MPHEQPAHGVEAVTEPMGSRIRRFRLAAGLSKAELARRVGVSDVTIGYWETGAIKQIGHARLVVLANALGCYLEELIGNNSDTLSLINDDPEYLKIYRRFEKHYEAKEGMELSSEEVEYFLRCVLPKVD